MLAVFAAGVSLVGAGATTRILALYPENREANALGPLSAHLEGQGGSGVISIKLPSGEVLKGRFKVTPGGSVGAYGKSRGVDRPGGAYTGAGDPILHGSPTFVDMEGPSGATVHCEGMNHDPHAHGSGVCRFSNGAEYRILY